MHNMPQSIGLSPSLHTLAEVPTKAKIQMLVRVPESYGEGTLLMKALSVSPPVTEADRDLKSL